MSKEEKPKQSRRRKEKYPALKKEFNLKRRSEFIETDYINGIYDSEGNEVIRPLTEEEKDFLNKFNEETINANFVHNPELRKKRKELKRVQLKLAEINPRLTDTIEELTKIERRLEKEVDVLRNEHLLYSDPEEHKKIYAEDYANKMCILSNSKAKGMLDEHKDEILNKIFENVGEFSDEIQVNEFHEKEQIKKDLEDIE